MAVAHRLGGLPLGGAAADEALTEVQDLRMRYGTRDVLTGVDFTVRRGEVLALLGPNGAGSWACSRCCRSAWSSARWSPAPRRWAPGGMLPVMVLAGISGIFYPIQQLWGWVQVLAQVFPMYWLGLGMRSAFFPTRRQRWRSAAPGARS
ncbi:MAG TPA: hypothetical protein VHG70_12305 [Nocardioidaceae bacterium]|nr:hypothetical protein [Nocardioidaceae bacterium]